MRLPRHSFRRRPRQQSQPAERNSCPFSGDEQTAYENLMDRAEDLAHYHVSHSHHAADRITVEHEDHGVIDRVAIYVTRATGLIAKLDAALHSEMPMSEQPDKPLPGNLLKVGTTVTVYAPPDELVPHRSWFRGKAAEIVAMGRNSVLYVVEVTDYKPEGEDWRPYDGIPHILAMYTPEQEMLRYFDTAS